MFERLRSSLGLSFLYKSIVRTLFSINDWWWMKKVDSSYFSCDRIGCETIGLEATNQIFFYFFSLFRSLSCFGFLPPQALSFTNIPQEPSQPYISHNHLEPSNSQPHNHSLPNRWLTISKPKSKHPITINPKIHCLPTESPLIPNPMVAHP